MITFYAPDIAQTLTLPESESAHIVRVLRRREGDAVDVVDGRGMRYKCVLVDAHPKRAAVEIVESCPVPLSWRQQLTLAIAPTKHLDRMEWLVEKLVEVGINRIVPLKCAHSERKELKTERLEKIAVSAMKQSLKAYMPTIAPMMPFTQYVAEIKDVDAQKFVGYCDDALPRKVMAKEYVPRRDTIVLIGPEGDFSPEEIAAAMEAGIVPVTFGDNRLRTETAALYAISACHIIDDNK
ncbi:MAG: 16S rRNA (uracil(1498)-N(3))-methyltransferase [Muribaculaceae bacterium]|nr:16S rRNA (uracil(1498)-N(3))-methyltransferase [Muribaculaceae bacterium]